MLLMSNQTCQRSFQMECRFPKKVARHLTKTKAERMKTLMTFCLLNSLRWQLVAHLRWLAISKGVANGHTW